ncbi:unnamed protein product [Penicillium salamii]|uniref:Major facilitator superfamily (MFS) profile domain-containing protein n=1 Tax=Penicillium salamii TaxID=1612424 RepID=A0A9W4NDW6_9EURO|nr:unnamed protein product [Penicillium salamii]CAG8041861.1 unnamed protein product [Penicillium salamii]CAG8340815.1 unnamed protein product [Penicillium salamii]CAG8341019.1 unnamed protein product [Penicillium salamii]CAG8343820.1 unnamed protein product [Penicillium salamii]
MENKSLIGVNKPFPAPLPASEDYVVEFNGHNDPDHPQNWKVSLKVFISVLVCSGTFIVSLTSAIFAPGIDEVSKAFGVSTVVGTLGTTLYVLGFSFGPVIWGPASELKGRKWPLTIAMLGGGIFTIASAVAKDLQTLIICRFFAGVCGASQLTVVPGVLADLYDNSTRGVAISLYALTVFVGPFMAPFVGGFIASSQLGWRWTLYIPAILSLVNGAISVLFLSETYPPCLLVAKAARIRKESGNWGIHARQEKLELDFSSLLEKYFMRPLKLLFMEPILLVVSLYMSFIYGLVYALLEAYPFVFESVYGMTPGVAGLMFIGLTIGVGLACTFILFRQVTYAKKLAENKGVPVPEWRLGPTLLGAPVFTVGLFWFGWTGFTSKIHWAAPAAAGIFIGFGVLCIFLPCFNYIVDSYLPIAASAVAANIILRSALAAGFPLFARQMFQNMGIQWAGTLLGCLAAIMIPIPIVFRAYGPMLRGKSRVFR